MMLKDLEIRNIIITKKVILGIIFSMFLFGVLLGACIALKEDNPTNSMGLYIFAFYVLIIFILYKSINKEILRKK